MLGLTCAQMYRVWTTYKKDQRATRLVLAVILVIDTFGTLSAFATVYLVRARPGLLRGARR
jgi:hypothetical protein